MQADNCMPSLRTYSRLYHVLPTWVPNWERASPVWHLDQTPQVTHWCSLLVSNREPCATFDNGDRTIQVSGLIVDTFDLTSSQNLDLIGIEGGKDFRRVVQGRCRGYAADIAEGTAELRRQQWHQIATRGQRTYKSTGEDIFDAYARTLVADGLRSRYAGNASAQGGEIPDVRSEDVTQEAPPSTYYKAWCEFRYRNFKNTHRTFEVEPEGSFDKRKLYFAEDFARLHHIASFQKTLLVSKTKRYLGLCLHAARPGDHIVLLRGARVPFVLRHVKKKGTQDESWKLLGEAYVHGLMCYETGPQDNIQDLDLENLRTFRIV